MTIAACTAAISAAFAPSARAESGFASVYAYKGDRTASGQRATPQGLTGAHRTLAFGTQVRVTHRRNGKSVIVRINDLFPFANLNRILDLSRAASDYLDMT